MRVIQKEPVLIRDLDKSMARVTKSLSSAASAEEPHQPLKRLAT